MKCQWKEVILRRYNIFKSHMKKLLITISAIFLLNSLYGQEAKSVISEDDLVSRSVTDAGAALQGKTAGLYVMNMSGAPGETARLRLRGFTTDTGNGGPLLIVDGLKVENIQHLDPSMIEKIEVLKDAAATALYGIQGGNGVIRITTRKGSGKVSVAYDFKLTSSFPGMKADLLNASEWLERVNKINPGMSQVVAANGHAGNDTDWQDVIYGNGLAHQHGLTAQGGNEKGGFFAAVNYLDNDGIMTGSSDTHRRIAAQLNGQYQITDWIQMGLNASLTSQKISYLPHSQSESSSVYKAILNADPVTKPYASGPEEFPLEMLQAYNEGKNIPKDPFNGQFYAGSFYTVDNPLLLKDVNKIDADVQDINAVMYARLTPFEGFAFTARAGYRGEQQDRSLYGEPFYANGYQSSDVYYHMAAEMMNSGYQIDAVAEYALSKGKHSLDTKAGMYYENVRQTLRNGYANSETSAVGYGDINFDSKDYKSSDMAFFAQAGYTFGGRYSVQASVRADNYKSDRFVSTENPWMIFPTVSAGAVVLKEPFVKLRGSWGKGGNTSDMEAFYNNRIQFVHQLSDHLDVGADAQFFKGRLGLTADWYVKNTEGLPMPDKGYSYDVTSVRNTGVEIDLSWKDKVGDFAYSISGNFSTLHNEVTSSNPKGLLGYTTYCPDQVVTIYATGRPMWSFYGYPSTSFAAGTYPDYEDMTYIGKGIPSSYFGLTLNMAYKGFDFSLYGSGTAGNDIASCAYYYHLPYKNVLRDINQKGVTEYYQWQSDMTVYDGSYFRIRQIQLGYTLPKRLTEKIFMRNARVFVSLDDWFTFSSYPGGDPETATYGSNLRSPWEKVYTNAGEEVQDCGTDRKLGQDYGSYPIARKLLFGISVRF